MKKHEPTESSQDQWVVVVVALMVDKRESGVTLVDCTVGRSIPCYLEDLSRVSVEAAPSGLPGFHREVC